VKIKKTPKMSETYKLKEKHEEKTKFVGWSRFTLGSPINVG